MTSIDAGLGGDGERGARWTAPGVDAKWNTVHPERYYLCPKI